MTIDQLIRDNPAATDAEIAGLANALPPLPRPSGVDTCVTYLSIGDDTERFGPGAINVAGKLRAGLEGWIAGPDLEAIDPRLPNRGALRSIHDRLAGDRGVDLSSPAVPAILSLLAAGVPAAGLPALLTPEQAATLLAIGYVVQPLVRPDAVAVARRSVRAERLKAACQAGQDAAANRLLGDPAASVGVLKGEWLAAFDDAFGGDE